MPRKLDLPSPEEDAAIQGGIGQDPDSPELDDEFFGNARPAHAVLPHSLYADLATDARDRAADAPPKVPVTLLLDQDVVERLRAFGPGWELKAGEALRRLIER